MRKLTLLLAAIVMGGLAFGQPVLHWKGLKEGVHDAKALPRTRTPGRSHLLVKFASMPGPGQLAELARRGVEVLSYVPDDGFSIAARDDVRLDSIGIQWARRLLPEEKISSELGRAATTGKAVTVLAEFYRDVDPADTRAIALAAGLVIRENPDVLPNQLLVSGTADRLNALAQWDEIAYIFPAADELIRGVPVRGCAGAMTAQGQVGQSVAIVGDGWDGPGKGSADLRYVFSRLSAKLPADTAKAEIEKALYEWSKYVQVTFTQTGTAANFRTLSVLFATGDHGDGYPFDGSGGALAHTYYPFPVNSEPIAGDMHFDDDETWSMTGPGIDLFSLALHEAGHALGLGHSDNPADVMYPYYRKVDGLSANDIAAIQGIYAARNTSPDPDPVPVDPPAEALALTIQTPASQTTDSSVSLSGTASGGEGGIQVSWTASSGYSGIATLTSSTWITGAIPLSIGTNTIAVTARDSQSQVTQNVTVTRQQPAAPAPPTPAPPSTPTGGDKTPPSITIVSPAVTSYSTSAGSLIVRGTARDNNGVASVTWSSSTGGSGTADGTTNWSTAPIPLYIGTTTITIRAADAAGNTSWRSLTVTRR